MAKAKKLIRRILGGRADANISFSGLCGLLGQLGFAERIRGDHHIFTKDGVDEILNLQPTGALAKPYQVRQVRGIVVQYKLGGEDDGEI
ncbi:MAG: type II toxin-antitoxin system HicA family toxin [Planctomycetes bacterium]|nr:type II toxin-antitoxin system HicA family toxin [Planctomycetota bacterium]